MQQCRHLCLVVAGLVASGWAWGQDPAVYRGICDASAAVALDAEHFAVADDEHDTLQIYRRGTPQPVGSLALNDFLGTHKESDLEGAATIGGVTYWIASHGRNADAELRPDRQRLFATERVPGASPPRLRPVGQASRRLLGDLLNAPALLPYALAAASRLAPEAPGGLNIEGLAATTRGRLLIGFRNPIPAGGALLVPIENPREVLAGRPARIGTPIELPLGGRGIRSIERVGRQVLIVAGPPADVGSFALYRWSGKAADKPVPLVVDLKDLRPEALFQIPGSDRVQLLSDDGGVAQAGVKCKDLPQAQRSIRSLPLKVGA
jgi:hypothetical protein